MTEQISYIPTRLKSAVKGGYVTGAGDIIDDGSGITLDELVGNKKYAPANFSGMGRVVLKKNILNGVNTLTQDMFYKGEVGSREPNANTIFVIRYDYVIDSANDNTITIPENCVLEFDGGSLKNGSINFNGATLKKEDSSNIFRNISSFSGEFVGYITPENVCFSTAFNCFDALVAYLKTSNTTLKIGVLSMDKDYDFNGVNLDAYEIDLNGYTLQLGGGYVNRTKNRDNGFGIAKRQKIEFIKKVSFNNTDTSSVIVRGSSGLDLYVGLYDGRIIFEPNSSNATGIAYSTFKLVAVQGLVFRSSVSNGWINNNQFFLTRVTSFIVENSNNLLIQFDDNDIYGGCFEGNDNIIRLEIGTNNHFHVARLEIQKNYSSNNKTGYILLSKLTEGNIFRIKHYPREFIYDYGTGNVFIDTHIYYGRPLLVDSLSLEDVKNSVPTKFCNIEGITEDNNVVAFHSTHHPSKLGTKDESDITYIYNSPYLEFTENFNITAILDFISKNEYAPALYYRLYDENLDDISVKNGTVTRPCARCLTAARTYTRGSSGFDNATTEKPFSIVMAGTVGERLGKRVVLNISRGIFNELIANGENIADQVANVKYVTVHVIGRNYYHTQNAQLLRLGFSIFDNSMNTYYLSSEIATMNPNSEQANFLNSLSIQ